MSSETVNQMVERLVQAGPLTEARFAALLGAPLQRGETSPFWQGFTFELAAGPFARGELRLNTGEDGALLILEPRHPPGLGWGDVDRAALGARLGVRSNPNVPPEGVDIEYFRKDAVQVTVEWTRPSRRLRSLALEWEPPTTAGTPTNVDSSQAST